MLKNYFRIMFEKQDDGNGGNPEPNTEPSKNEPNTEPTTESNSEPKDDKKFTQEELNGLLANEKKAAKAKILKDLGIEDPEKIKEIIKKQKAEEDANKSAVEKLNEKEKAIKEANDKLAEYEARDKAMDAGVDAKKAKEFIKLAMNIGEGDDIDSKIKSTIEKYPFYKEGSQPKDFGKKSGGTGKSSMETDAATVRKYMGLK